MGLAIPRSAGEPNVPLIDLDADRYRGRDRDRFVERSMPSVVVDQGVRFSLSRTGESEMHVDSLKNRGVTPLTDGFEVHIQAIQSDPGITCSALNHQDAAGGNTG